MDLTVTSAKLTGDVNKDVKTLANHVFQLEENLRYALRNLDVTNFNDLGLARYENGRLQVYSEVVEVQAKKLRLEFGEETDEIYAQISATAEELLSEISDVNSGLGSQIKQTADEVSAIVQSIGDGNKVTAASIVAKINDQGEGAVKIKADKVDISGIVTFTDLSSIDPMNTTIINGSLIKAGVINAVDFVAKGDMYSAPSSMTGFVAQDSNKNNIGRVGYGINPNAGLSEYEYQRRDQLYLATYEYYYNGYTYRPTVKILGAGGISMETGSGSPVYIKGSSYLTLKSDIQINIDDNWGTRWAFFDGGLWKVTGTDEYGNPVYTRML